MSYHQHPYLNGTLLKESEPLFRYLPPYPEGVYSDWAAGDAGIKKGDWILDPFGASPYAALELAAQGYRVLMLSNNPVINFITEVLAESPSELDFKAALSELTKIRRGDEWLDQHLNNLYSTQCPSCNSPIAASAFLWRKGDNTPYACIYRCDKCQSEGEKPCSQTDIEQLNRIGSDKLHRARALQRVIDLNSDAQDDVLEILGHYLTRPLYFITTLINKIEGSDMPVQRQKLLYALILSICDQGNTLWGHPSGRTRPKQLLTPAVFKELNLWAVLESSIKNWSNRYSPVELCRYPAAPLSNGICLLSGRLRTLAELPDSITPAAVICTLPRPNQAFWSLSAIWSGWLWGKENVDPMKSMLERKRFDWNWLDNALALSFSHLNRLLPDGIPFFTIFSELDPGFITAGLHAAASTGLSIKAAALCEEDDLLQTWWNNNKTSKNIKNSPGLESNLRQSVISFLSQIVEPASYIRLLSHALLESCDNYSIVQKSSKSQTLSSIRLIQNNFDSILNHTSSVIGFQQEHTGIETKLWGLRQPLEIMSLSDQVEMNIVNALLRKPLRNTNEIQQEIYEQFPGLLTPSRELINACLESYAEAVISTPGEETKWQLHSREQPATRKNDIEAIVENLKQIGLAFGYRLSEHNPLLWFNAEGELEFIYHIIASGIISKHIYNPKQTARHCVIVLPGSRSRLLSYKLEKDPNLNRMIQEKSWKFLKFRHVRNLAGKNNLPADRWLQLITLDPPLWEDAVQMSIFPS